MRLVLIFLACAFLPTWGSAQGIFDDNEARRRIERLRQEVETYRQGVEARISKLEEGTDQRAALIDIAGQLETLRGEIAKMRGQLELLAHQAETAEARQKQLYLDIDTRLRKLEQTREQAAVAPEKPAVGAQADAEPSPGEAKAYQAALNEFKLGNYSRAVAAMEGFLVTYPNSSLAPNAQYWVGMAHSGQRDYKSAIAAQRKLLATWPDNPKAPDAMLSIASAQETMGDRAAARKTLEELIAKYPGSSSANSAKQRLAAFSRR